MEKTNFSLPPYIVFLFRLMLVTLLTFTLFRILLYAVVIFSWISASNPPLFQIIEAFIMGLRFDVVVTGYLFILPFTLLGVLSILNKQLVPATKLLFNYFTFCSIVSIIILSSDIPYFIYFFSRLNISALSWMDDGAFMFNMIFHEPSFFFYLILSIVLSILAVVFLRREKRLFLSMLSENTSQRKRGKRVFEIVLFITLGFAFLVGMRGRISHKSTIQIGTAYFSNDPFLNQIGLNPVYTFVFSIVKDLGEKDKVQLVDADIAMAFVSSALGASSDRSSSFSPISRYENSDGTPPTHANVIFIIMESMGSFKLGQYSGPQNLTPNLNNLISKSLYFDSIYTAGIHTYNGIYSTLFSFPALYDQQPLEELLDLSHGGIAQTLKEEGYSTMYFTTHDPQFDNVEGFLRANGYDNVFSEFDYPSEWVQSTNGVPDHKMFEFAIPTLNSFANKGGSFFAVFMTSSDHKPYIIPQNIDFEPRSKTIGDQITEYADWSIGQFIKNASAQVWFDNTVFVLIGDHGVNMGHTYDMPLSYHHSPLIIYSPSLLPNPDTLHNLGGQIDVSPTVLGILNIPFENNTMGINLLHHSRPFMYFCTDDKIGCLDNEYYLIVRPGDVETLYRYEMLSTKNYIDEYPDRADRMKQYAYSMMQATQELIDQNKLGDQKNKPE